MPAALPQWILERPIAHRGLHDTSRNVPENSLSAFDAAAARGFPAELDVRVSADRVAVVIHDTSLHRMTNVDTDVADVDSATLQSLPLGESTQTIPLLADVLNAVAARAPLLIEVKNEGVAGDVEEATLFALDGYAGEVAVQSFNPHTLQWFSHHAPDIPRGLLSGDFRGAEMDPTLKKKLRDLEMIDISDPHFIGYDVRCLPFEPLMTLREGGMPVLGWTVDSPGAEAAARAYCDNIIFEGYIPKA